jgi:uncharacterized glyoxalase superfamily protein PhnB
MSGGSFQQRQPKDRDPEYAPVAPEFFVPDVGAAVRYYTDAFGFRLLRADPAGEPNADTLFAILRLGDEGVVMFMNERWYGGEPEPRGRSVDIRFMVAGVDAVYKRCREHGVQITHDIADRDYGLRDFIARDQYGFRLRFASPLA